MLIPICGNDIADSIRLSFLVSPKICNSEPNIPAKDATIQNILESILENL
jgi:hypothetical protein